ncbi:MAG: NAD(P)/FAD-dependent oxidoreductase, partial [Nitrospirae bacterium]|nr:NAD(P)/FAD-dependent oxidoreductase [Nitrospirota bacterium]
LSDNRNIDCDLIIISAGIRMNLTIPQQLGMTIDKGLVVNNRMETGIPDIYAAGDLVQHNGQCYGIWPAAEQQGEVAGINMAGGNAEYRGTTMSNTLSVAGVDIFAAGDIDPEGKKEAIFLNDPANRTYRKLVMENDIITGAILLGDTRDRRKVMHAMDTRSDISGIRMKLEAGDFSPL